MIEFPGMNTWFGRCPLAATYAPRIVDTMARPGERIQTPKAPVPRSCGEWYSRTFGSVAAGALANCPIKRGIRAGHALPADDWLRSRARQTAFRHCRD